MAIKGVFFDAAGVLYQRPESTSTYVSRLLNEMGLLTELSAQDAARQRAIRTEANTGRLRPSDYWDQSLRMYGVDDPVQRQALISQIDSYSDGVLALPGGRQALAILEQRGFLLGIVTDTIYPIERKMRWLGQIGVVEFIDVVACSTVVGACKPEPGIYMDALQQAGLTPRESAFVGHDADELDGAHRVGMATVAVNHDADARADYYARSLPDLLNVPIFDKSHT